MGHSRLLDTLLAAMPGAKRAEHLRRALVEHVDRGELMASQIQPSVAFGESDSFRLMVDAGRSLEQDRGQGRRILETLLVEFAIPFRFAECGAAWVEGGGELFLGIATAAQVRTKAYFRHRDPSALSALRRDLDLKIPAFDAPHSMFGLDFITGQMVAAKHYLPTRLQDHDCELRRFLRGRDLRAHLARRLTSEGITEIILHVQVESLSDPLVGVRWAEVSGAKEALLLARIEAEVRVLSEVLGKFDGRHVYLAPLDGPSQAGRPLRQRP